MKEIHKKALNKFLALSGVLVVLVVVLTSTVIITNRSNVGVTTNHAAVATLPNANFVYYLPLFSKNDADFTTTSAFAQNPNGNTVADATIYAYEGSSGQLYQSSFSCGVLNTTNNPPFPQCAVPNPFPGDGFSHKGSAIIFSNNELNILTTVPLKNFKGTAYEPVLVPNNLVTLTVALNSYSAPNQSNLFSTSYLSVTNVDDQNSTNATINVYDDSGKVAGTQTYNIGPHVQKFLAYQDFVKQFSLPTGFVGSVQISTDNGAKLIAQTAEAEPTTGRYTILNGSGSPLTSQYFPTYLSNWDSYISYKRITNPTNNTSTVKLDYYSSTGASDGSITLTVPPHASVNQRDNLSISPQNTPGTTYPANNSFGYSTVTASEEGVVVSENIFNGDQIFESLPGLPTAATNMGMAILSNGAYSTVSGMYISNPNSTTINGNIYYYDTQGNYTNVGSSLSIPAHSTLPIYLPNTSLPSNFIGSGRITLNPGDTAFVVTNNLQTDSVSGKVTGAYMYANPNPLYAALTQYSPSPTPIQTTNPLPSTLPITGNSGCLCGANNMCTSACTFNSPDPNTTINGANIKCSREAAILPAPSLADQNSYCNRPNRTLGDANGDGVVDNTDYFYYVRAVNGGAVTTVVDADINGDGIVSPNDRLIIVTRLKTVQ